MREEPRDSAALESVRLDVWLDVACLYPTRSQAKAACEGGKVDVNGAHAKRTARSGRRPRDDHDTAGDPRVIIVRALPPFDSESGGAQALRRRHASRAAEIAEARRLDRMLAPRDDTGRPDRDERRERIRRKGR